MGVMVRVIKKSNGGMDVSDMATVQACCMLAGSRSPRPEPLETRRGASGLGMRTNVSTGAAMHVRCAPL